MRLAVLTMRAVFDSLKALKKIWSIICRQSIGDCKSTHPVLHIQTSPIAELERENVLSLGEWGVKHVGYISKEILSLPSVSWDEIKMVSDKVREQI